MNQKALQKKKPLTNNLQLQLLISSEEIEKRLETVARKLEEEYSDKELTIIMILKGAIVLVSDLMRHLHLPVCFEMIQCSSYGEGGMKKGKLEISGLDTLQVEGKHLLIVDDIFDTGDTLSQVFDALKQKGPASLRSLVLLSKDVPRKIDYRPDTTLFEIEDRFAIGYGLDYKEYYRGLPDIYAIEI
ncbi:hypoxanthine phosphoribosyltransferase [Candidatus Neptunochlamydia vexilliferae]|uniref:hypoxanthine phosphoribosyltransferase n=1 Tax=Candidatus Neptunichlamydia vexilliferae TaxID=1651774 RepID=UPI0018914A12|nr:hypoxanthine phosphoribosyltransferase [Candidatus Neptunochlamydia vexilliferae]